MYRYRAAASYDRVTHPRFHIRPVSPWTSGLIADGGPGHKPQRGRPFRSFTAVHPVNSGREFAVYLTNE